MNKPQAAAAPETGTKILSFEDLASDPEIASLLEFDAVPRQIERPDGWTPQLQKELIAYIAHFGSPNVAANALGKNPSGAKNLYRADGGESFKSAWQAAMALARARQRKARAAAHRRPDDVPGMPDRAAGPQMVRHGRSRFPAPYTAPLAPGQVYNEHGQPEDEASFRRRGEDARDNIGEKLLRCRRHFLAEISRNPGKRAAFEILTELPIDWAKARRMEPQDHEPWRRPRMPEPDMVLTAENGWLGSIVPYGPDKIGELRKAVNKERKRKGLAEIDWDQPDSLAECEATPQPTALLSHSSDPLRHPREGGDPAEDNAPAPQGPPPSRTFGLNSQEFYDAVARPGKRARIEPRD